MIDIMKIGKSLKESGLLSIGVLQTIKNEAKEQKGKFLRILLGTSLLGNLLKVKETSIADEDTVRAGQDFNAASSFNKF